MRSATTFFWRFRGIHFLLWAAMLGLAVAGASWGGRAYAAGETSTSVHAANEATEASVVQTVWGILGYSRWPDHPKTLQLCIVGETAYAEALSQVPMTSNGRSVEVRHIANMASGAAQGCHAIYAGVLPQQQWQQWIAQRPSGAGLLTINEKHDTCPQDSIFCLDLSQKNVGFELNLDAMARSGVKVSPRVFGLSKRKEAP